MTLTKKERKTLEEIAVFSAIKGGRGYSKLWSPKTTQKLAAAGLVSYAKDGVFITDTGTSALKEPEEWKT